MCKRGVFIPSAFLLLFLLLLPLAWGQGKTRFSIKEGATLKLKLETMRAPDFKDSAQGISGRSQWGVLSLEFELANRKDEWVDELEVYCLVLAQQKGGTVVALEQSFQYMDVCGGERNRVQLFITPTFFSRYMDSGKRPDMSKLSAYMEIRVGGSPIHKNLIISTATGLPKDWYQQVGRVKRINNALFPKSKTPFASLDFDYYLYELPIEPR
jgi:hypothetical protein